MDTIVTKIINQTSIKLNKYFALILLYTRSTLCDVEEVKHKWGEGREAREKIQDRYKPLNSEYINPC